MAMPGRDANDATAMLAWAMGAPRGSGALAGGDGAAAAAARRAARACRAVGVGLLPDDVTRGHAWAVDKGSTAPAGAAGEVIGRIAEAARRGREALGAGEGESVTMVLRCPDPPGYTRVLVVRLSDGEAWSSLT